MHLCQLQIRQPTHSPFKEVMICRILQGIRVVILEICNLLVFQNVDLDAPCPECGLKLICMPARHCSIPYTPRLHGFSVTRHMDFDSLQPGFDALVIRKLVSSGFLSTSGLLSVEAKFHNVCCSGPLKQYCRRLIAQGILIRKDTMGEECRRATTANAPSMTFLHVSARLVCRCIVSS